MYYLSHNLKLVDGGQYMVEVEVVYFCRN